MTNVSACFDGTQDGNLITDISNVSLSLSGQVIPTAVVVQTDDGTNGPAVVSIDGTQNNFLFFTINYFYDLSSITGNAAEADNGEAVIWLNDIPDSLDAFDDGLGADPNTLEPLNCSWTVSDLSAASSVPDGGATIAMLGVALTGLAVLRRKFGTPMAAVPDQLLMQATSRFAVMRGGDCGGSLHPRRASNSTSCGERLKISSPPSVIGKWTSSIRSHRASLNFSAASAPRGANRLPSARGKARSAAPAPRPRPRP